MAIIRGLSDHFTEEVVDTIKTDLRAHDGWVIVSESDNLGLIVVDRRSPRVAEILWMAIKPAVRGQGLGSRLLDHVLGLLGDEGVDVVEVKTLDRTASYAPYDATAAFWERHGFVQIDTIDPLPGWQSGNPAAIYVAALRSTT